MPYDIRLSNNSELITGGLLDNTTNTTSSSLTLVGKNFKSYGLFLNQNFVRLMENFAKTTAPTAPLPGQLWYNSTTKYINLNVAASPAVAAQWKPLAVLTVAGSTPASPVTGEQWYDSTNSQLNVFTGSEWKIIGPLTTTATGNTGALPDVIVTGLGTFIVIKFFINDVLVGIWSNNESFATTIGGFTTINKGLNFHSSLGHTFWGNAQAANTLYVGGTPLAGSSFLRNDQSGIINGALTLTNNNGLTFGSASDFVGSVSNGHVTLRNQTNNKDLILSININSSQTPFLRGNSQSGLIEGYSNPTSSSSGLSLITKNYFDQVLGVVSGRSTFFANVNPGANVTYTLGNVDNRWMHLYAGNVTTSNIITANVTATKSNVTTIFLGEDLIPTGNLISNVGAPTKLLNTIFANNGVFSGNLTAVASSAQYADLAEMFQSDKNYDPGTVVVFGGDKEITTTNISHDTAVAGVISTSPAYTMNADSEGLPVALTGRVPCLVKGPVNKGTVLVTGSTPGTAEALDMLLYKPGCVLGKSLESIASTNTELIEIAVGRF